MVTPPPSSTALVAKLETTPEAVEFAEALFAIDSDYDFAPVQWVNGAVDNAAGTNTGSAKIVAFAQLASLSTKQALACYGHHFRDLDPDGTSHANIRALLKTGLQACKFPGSTAPLVRRTKTPPSSSQATVDLGGLFSALSFLDKFVRPQQQEEGPPSWGFFSFDQDPTAYLQVMRGWEQWQGMSTCIQSLSRTYASLSSFEGGDATASDPVLSTFLESMQRVLEGLKTLWEPLARECLGKTLQGDVLTFLDLLLFPTLNWLFMHGFPLHTDLSVTVPALAQYHLETSALECVGKAASLMRHVDPKKKVRKSMDIWRRAVLLASQVLERHQEDPASSAANMVEVSRAFLKTSTTDFTLDYYRINGLLAGGKQQTPAVPGLGAGDSCVHFDILSDDMVDTAFATLQEEISWVTMFHKGGAVPRLVCVQGALERDLNGKVEGIPLYRHPADQEPQLLPFTPFVRKLRDLVVERIGQPLNHALIQLYRGGQDYISEHADKTIDIERGSMVCNLSIGSSRVMLLRRKRDASTLERARKEKVTLPHSSLFCLGWDTNRAYTHEIKQDKRPLTEKRPDELLEAGGRISLTFRNVRTFQCPDTKRLYGQGAKVKSRAEMMKATDTPDLENDVSMSETERLVQAFAEENKSSTFDWDKYYGEGFDVVNMHLLNDEPSTVVLSK
jgi:alkylated DNA repair dioxygenase AlkB